MADISTWSPLDESNVAAPPDGWPENQPTNTVNNCGRAMQGAIRRWYDQLAAGTAEIAYLSLSGCKPVSPP
jgi:acetyl-CoA acetyltransferase